MKYKIADLIVEFDSKYDITVKRAEKYKINNNEKEHIKITIKDESIKREMEFDKTLTEELAEYMVIGSAFYRELLNYNGCMLHSSAVVIDNEAYLFSADCGTGKSTHTSLWIKYLKDKNPYILNDDKPAIRIIDDEIYAYGTPFSGKNDISQNTRAKLKGICFLEQAKENSIKRLEPKEALNLFFAQTVRRLTEKQMNKLLDIIEVIIKKIPIYKLSCNISEEAVKLSYKTMRGENTNEN